jgi:GTP cyclohydrolase I
MADTQIENFSTRPLMPDISAEKPLLPAMSGALDWVGMSGIEVPVQLTDSEGRQYRTAAKANAFVSLKSETSRGIHMSRLFRETQEQLASKNLDAALIQNVLENFLKSQEDLSESARLEIDFHALVLRKALVSNNKAWRTYPVKISGELKKNALVRLFVETEIIYSSTCPASAALSRQLIQDNFKTQFRNQDLDFKRVYDFLGSSQGIIATPHAQRSVAKIKVEIAPANEISFQDLINWAEEALQTPVQTTVKREDEQEFALRNGQNLMFCEDAARRLQATLSASEAVQAFWVEVKHLESLHPHDAMAFVSGSKI